VCSSDLILDEADWSDWLSAAPLDDTKLAQWGANRLQAWPVGKAVGNVRAQGSELIQRLSSMI